MLAMSSLNDSAQDRAQALADLSAAPPVTHLAGVLRDDNFSGMTRDERADRRPARDGGQA